MPARTGAGKSPRLQGREETWTGGSCGAKPFGFKALVVATQLFNTIGARIWNLISSELAKPLIGGFAQTGLSDDAHVLLYFSSPTQGVLTICLHRTGVSGKVLLEVKKNSRWRASNSFPHRSNTLRGMAKKALAAQVLADNLGKLMELKKVDSGPKLAKLSKVSQKSISNMLSSRHDPYLSTIEKVAGALGIQPHQLLCPVADNDFLAVCLAWAQSDERGRGDLHAIAVAILNRQNRGNDQAGDSIPSTNAR